MYFIQVFCAALLFVNYVSSEGFEEYEEGKGNSGYGSDRIYREEAIGEGIKLEGNGAFQGYSNTAGLYSKGFGGNGAVGIYDIYGIGIGVLVGEYDDTDPHSYSFSYAAPDERGNSHYREEKRDENGNVVGSYGYTDEQGLYRVVQYVADAGGFRATVLTNEPGVDDRESPADVSLYAEQPPAGIQDKYSPPEDSQSYGAHGINFGIGMNGGSHGIGYGKFGSNGGFVKGMGTVFYGVAYGNGNGAGANKMKGGFEGGIGSGSYGNENEKNGTSKGKEFGLGSSGEVGGPMNKTSGFEFGLNGGSKSEESGTLTKKEEGETYERSDMFPEIQNSSEAKSG